MSEPATTLAAVPSEPVEPQTDYDRYQAAKDAAHWTAAIRKFALRADDITLAFRPVDGRPNYHRDARWCDVRLSRKEKDGSMRTLEFTIPAYIHAGFKDATREAEPSNGMGWTEYSRDDANIHAPLRGVWHESLFPGQHTHEQSVLASIPVDASIVAHVRLDEHSSPIMAEAGLHGDVLELEIGKGKRTLRLNFATRTSHHNTARFGDRGLM